MNNRDRYRYPTNKIESITLCRDANTLEKRLNEKIEEEKKIKIEKDLEKINSRLLSYLQHFTNLTDLNQFIQAKIAFIKEKKFPLIDDKGGIDFGMYNRIHPRINDESKDELAIINNAYSDWQSDKKLYKSFIKIIEKLEELNKSNIILDEFIEKKFIDPHWKKFLLSHPCIRGYGKEYFFHDIYDYFFISIIQKGQVISNENLPFIENYVELQMRLVYLNCYKLFFNHALCDEYMSDLKKYTIKDKDLLVKLIDKLNKIEKNIENIRKEDVGKFNDAFHEKIMEEIDEIEAQLPKKMGIKIYEEKNEQKSMSNTEDDKWLKESNFEMILNPNPKKNDEEEEQEEKKAEESSSAPALARGPSIANKKNLLPKETEEKKAEEGAFAITNEKEKLDLLNAFFDKKRNLTQLTKEKPFIISQFLKLSLASLKEELTSPKLNAMMNEADFLVQTAIGIEKLYPKEMEILHKIRLNAGEIVVKYANNKEMNPIEARILAAFHLAAEETQFGIDVLEKGIKEIIWKNFLTKCNEMLPELKTKHPLVILSEKSEEPLEREHRFAKLKIWKKSKVKKNDKVEEDTAFMAIQKVMGEDEFGKNFIQEKAKELGIVLEVSELSQSFKPRLFRSS